VNDFPCSGGYMLKTYTSVNGRAGEDYITERSMENELSCMSQAAFRSGVGPTRNRSRLLRA